MLKTLKIFLTTTGLAMAILLPNFVFCQQKSLEENVMGQIEAAAGKTEWKGGEAVDPRLLVAGVIQTALSLLGIIFVILMVLGGYRRFISRGDEEKIKKADKTILAAVVGLVIILLSYAITDFIAKRIYEAAIEGEGGGYEIKDSGPVKYEWNVPVVDF